MFKRTLLYISCAYLSFMLLPVCAADDGEQPLFHSVNGHFNVSYVSQLNPVVINQIHSWTLHVTDADGNPVDGADIAAKGGMPAHNHGLATAPTIASQGNGYYLLQGLRFHMMGHWELTLTINADGTNDQVLIDLDL